MGLVTDEVEGGGPAGGRVGVLRGQTSWPLSSTNGRSPTMSLTRVQFFSISLDGFGTGEGQSLDTPFGHAGERLHEWLFTTRWWNEMAGRPGGTGGTDDAFARLHDVGIGAEIMGGNKFGPPGWHKDQEGKGWGGSSPR